MKAKYTTLSAFVLACSLMTGPTARAQQAPAASPSPAQQERAALNSAEADAASQQLSQDEINQRQHDAAMAHWRHDQATYHTESRDHAAQTAEYQAAMAHWHEDVAACNAGDTSRCVPAPQN